MYHAIVVEESIRDRDILANYPIVRTKISGGWRQHILEIKNKEQAIAVLQENLVKNEPYYFHLYDNGKELIVCFKNEIYRLNPNNHNTWQGAFQYGTEQLDIPAYQLDFFPTRIAEEKEWLKE